MALQSLVNNTNLWYYFFMPGLAPETTLIRLATHNTTWPILGPGNVAIKAIDGIYNEDGSTFPHPIRQYAEIEYVDRVLTVPSTWPNRIGSFFNDVMRMNRDYSCHTFAKWLLGIAQLTG